MSSKTLATRYVWVAALCSAALAHADRVVLFDEVYVKGPEVRLSDVAEIEGEMLEAVGDIEIAPAARPGAMREVHAALVVSSLRRAGVDTDAIVFDGARRVRANTLYSEIPREAIAASLYTYIEQTMPWEPVMAEIDVPKPFQDERVPAGDYELHWSTRPDFDYVGPGSFRADILVDGLLHDSLMLRATVEPYAEIAVAAGDITRGRRIQPSDIRTEPRKLTAMPRGAVLAAEDVIGLVARRTIFQGQPISRRDAEAPLIIQRNQLVPVVMRVGALTVRARAKAMDVGRAGEMVALTNLQSGERFQGLVAEDGVVYVY